MSSAAGQMLSDELVRAILDALAQTLPGYVSCIDRSRTVVYINRMQSRQAHEVIARSMDEFIAPEHRAETIRRVERAFASQRPDLLNYQVVLRDGTSVYMATRIVPFTSPTGQPLALLLTEDISERKRLELELELEHSNEFRRRVIENLPDYVTLIDRESRFVWVNRLRPGLKPEDVLGHQVAEFRPAETSEAGDAAIREAFEARRIGQYEAESHYQGKPLGWYQVRAVPIVVDDQVENVLLITSDISERKRAEQALRQTQEQLHQSQRLEGLGQLAGGVAHDFNNLLQIIHGNLEFARDRLEQGESPSEELEQIQRATERAGELTGQLLTVARRTRVEPRRLNLGELVESSLRMLRRAIPENVALSYEGPDDPCYVELDAARFEQVLINLCVNARDAMPRGGVLTVRVRAEDATHAVVSVEDSGCGIAPENLRRIFEPFFTTKQTGSGLGLAVAMGIVAAHNGELFADSDGRSGTTISVRLPRAEAEGGVAPSPAPPLVSRGGCILVAEDEDLVRAQTVRILERAGFEVLQATTGAEAVRIFREQRGRIDLVVLDVIMPELDGWRAFLQLAELRPNVKALFTTGYSADVLPKDLSGGRARLLTKPFKPPQLLAEVNRLLASPTESA
jgi:two-component system cell cycle sensor histidine kinase/response regulator CckA